MRYERVPDLGRAVAPVVPAPKSLACVLEGEPERVLWPVRVARSMVAKECKSVVARAVSHIHPVEDHVVLDRFPGVEEGVFECTFTYVEGSCLCRFPVGKFRRE